MVQRWRESEWGKVRSEHKDSARPATQWIGTSFDIGVFLGMNILADSPPQQVASPVAEAASSRRAAPSAGPETFVTAPSCFSAARTPQSGRLPSLVAGESSQGYNNASSSGKQLLNYSKLAGPNSANSSTPLLRSSLDVRQERPGQIPFEVCAPKETNVSSLNKGKARMVHYSEVSADERPISPLKVLARSGEAVQDSSAGAAEQATAENQVEWGEVIMRDRMFVRMCYSEQPLPSPNFDESHHRTTRNLENERWIEYIVAWRKDRLELYKDHFTPGKDWLLGRKELNYVIPLGSPQTRLSLYSFVDSTFCLLCPPTSPHSDTKRLRHLLGTKGGTNIFIFKHKSRTRAIDWIWKLWRHLGGRLPPYVDIRCPAIDTHISIDIPHYDGADIAAAYTVFNKQNIISLCEHRLKTVHEYKTLIEDKLAEGARMEMAWRFETSLDWVWQLDDVQGKPREWAVLCGLALKQSRRASHLEIRLKEHLPSHLHLNDGTRLDEPPAVEGYLERVKPNSQLRQAVYLTTHGGYLFAVNRSHANHPLPRDLTLNRYGIDDVDAIRRAEVQRGMRQVLHTTGMTDLRGIVAVRRAFQLVPQHAAAPESEAASWEDTGDFWQDVGRSESDEEDAGGDEGMANAHDKSTLRMRRSFELLMMTGHVVRFEAYSCQTALEWIVRLRPLVSYWKKRHKVDARQEMDISHFSTGRERITPKRRIDENEDSPPEPIPDPDTSLPELGSFFNWCVLEGCRPLLKCGKIFARQGLRGQYLHMQLVLISGNLVQYRITGRPSLHHRKHKVISLLDAYVCSGYLAAQYLPDGQYDPNTPPAARRYQDGLEADDSEEDTLFLVWYRKSGRTDTLSPGGPAAEVPPLSGKRKLEIFRTRSKLERDAWVWAINSAIEKVVRASQTWEDRLREAGQLLKP
ncbi:Pleckstrin homology domain-containing protein [Sparassis latifolia]